MGEKRITSFEVSNCMDCGHHVVRAYPDPNDYMWADREQVICTKMNPKKVIAVDCEINCTRSKCNIPEWCVLPKAQTKTSCEVI